MITEDKVIEIFYMADEYSKLHLIINDRGEILNFMITPGNTDDRKPLRNERYVQDSSGKLCGDRALQAPLFQQLHCQHSLGYRCLLFLPQKAIGGRRFCQ